MQKALPIELEKSVLHLVFSFLGLIITTMAFSIVIVYLNPIRWVITLNSSTLRVIFWVIFLGFFIWSYMGWFRDWYWSFSIDEHQIKKRTFFHREITLKRDAIIESHYHQGGIIYRPPGFTLKTPDKTLRINSSAFPPKEQVVILAILLEWVPRSTWDAATQKKLPQPEQQINKTNFTVNKSMVITTPLYFAVIMRLFGTLLFLIGLGIVVSAVFNGPIERNTWISHGVTFNIGLIGMIATWVITLKTTVEVNENGLSFQRIDYAGSWKWEAIDAISFNTRTRSITVWSDEGAKIVPMDFIREKQRKLFLEVLIQYLSLHQIPFKEMR